MTDGGVGSGIMDIYCWIHSTYSVNTTGRLAPHPGLGEDSDQPGHAVHHKYYQWVAFFLTLQAAMFYLPRLLWKAAEGGVMKLRLLRHDPGYANLARAPPPTHQRG